MRLDADEEEEAAEAEAEAAKDSSAAQPSDRPDSQGTDVLTDAAPGNPIEPEE
jgi:hypothetical protein